nr:hypothetical protein [Tanacetum cinerariifolium]
MSTLAEFMILSGGDNPPPMLEKHLTKKYEELSPTEKNQFDCDLKTTNIILQVNQQTYLVEFPQIDSGLAVLVFMRGDDPIDSINQIMSFLSTFVSSRFPTTNNQLRNSSNLRQQATIHDGRVTVQSIQGRQSSFAAGQQRVVKCFNWQREGHMARQCPKPKRKRDATWYRDKVLLVKAQQSSKVLNEEELEFLSDTKVAEGPVTLTIMKTSLQPRQFLWPICQVTDHIFSLSVIAKETNVISTADFEETLMLRKRVDFGKRFVSQQELSDEQAFRLQTSHPNIDQSAFSPVKIKAPRKLSKDKSCNNQGALKILEYSNNNDLKAQLQAKDTTICKLKEHINSMRENDKEEKVKHVMDEIETINIGLEHSVAKLLYENEHLHKEIDHLKQSYKDQFDSIKRAHVSSKEYYNLQKLKGKEIIENVSQIPNGTTIAPEMFKLDLYPLAPRKPKQVKSVGLSKKAKILESKISNNLKPNHSLGSNATDVPSSSYLVNDRFGNDQIAKILGYADYQLRNVTILRNLDSVDLHSGSRVTNLYTISLDDMLKTTLICLLSKASKTKSWLWHRRLSHLNFGTLNKLAKEGLAQGIPKKMKPKRTTKSSPATTTTTTTSVTNAQLKALIHQGVARALAARDADVNTNDDDSHVSGTSARRTKRVTRECTYPEFMKCKPLNFKGIEGVVELTQCALTWWNSHVMTVGPDATYAMTWVDMKNKMNDKYCPMGEIKKLESKLWNLRKQGVDIAYTVGLGEMKEYAGTLPLCNKYKFHHNGQCTVKCINYKRVGHLTRDCRSLATTKNHRKPTCYECGNHGHYISDCPELKNKDHGNQDGDTEAHVMVHALGGGEINQDLNDVEDDINA